MNKKEYLDFIESELEDLKSLIKKKNKDYSHGDDPFANFRIAEQYNLSPIQGLLLRKEDKLQRQRAWVNRGSLSVDGESIEDALRDEIGYCLLALGILKENRDSQMEELGLDQ